MSNLTPEQPEQEPDWEALHDALPDDAHTCPEWDLDPKGCYLATPCAGTFSDGTACRTRRDEHADQPYPSSVPSLDITGHTFVEPTGYRTPDQGQEG